MTVFKSITRRIVFLHIIAICITSVFMPLVLYLLLRSAAEDLQHRSLRENAEVIARYLKAEMDAADTGPTMAITPANYKFKYKGSEERNGRAVYILHLTPRQKKVGLFKGELWLDAETYMPVRESGSFVKAPSMFLKNMRFVREYELQNGVSIPQRIESKADVRFIGPVELSINFLRFSKDDQEDVAASAADQQ